MPPITRRQALGALAAGALGLGTARAGRAVAPGAPPAVGTPHQGAPEILIRGGTVVNATGSRAADVRVRGEVVAEVGTGLLPGPEARVIDAAGRLVLPGGIDPHTHLHPGFVDDLTTGSWAALAGGVTTVGTFAYPAAGETLPDAVDRLAGEVARDAVADVILHASAWPPTAAVAAQLPVLAARGQPSFKVFMTRADFESRVPELVRLLESARRAGVVTMVHCEDGALLAEAVRRLEAEGRTSLEHYADSRPVRAETAATAQAAALCERTGAPMYVVHLSSAGALEVCRSARAAGLPFHVETRPLYLHLNEERMAGPDGPLHVGQPPLRTAADQGALWGGLAEGAIDVLATDHAPWTRAQKLDPSLSITRLRPGVSNLQFMLPMYFSEGVGKGRIGLERFVETTSTNAARIFGLHPRKGVVAEGSDADLVVWNPHRSGRVRGEADLSRADYSVYEGWEVVGWPETTLRRGEVVYEAGEVTGRAGSGRLVEREPWRG